MYGEPFTVPEPLETVFVSWFEGGEVFRSGLTYQRGAGRIFYFRPGPRDLSDLPPCRRAQVLRNAVHWAHNPAPGLDGACRRAERADRQGQGAAGPERPAAACRRRSRAAVSDAELASVLGTGGIAGHHVAEFARRSRNAEIVACVDAVPGPRRSFCRRTTASRRPSTSSMRRIAWGEFDAAINCTPDGVHYGDDAGAAGRRQACVLRKAAGAEPSRRLRHDRGGRSSAASSTWSTSPTATRRRCRRRAPWSRPARSARCAMSRRPTARAGWSARHWGDWRDRRQMAVAAVDEHGSTGVLGDVGIHILDFAAPWPSA